MNGIERMDKPRRWPVWSVAGLVALLAAGLIWQRFHRAAPVPPSEALAVPLSASSSTPELESTAPTAVANVAAPAVQVPVVPVVLASTNPAALALAAEADALLAEGKKDKAREQYLAALEARPDDALRVNLEEKAGALNVELIRLPWPMPEKQEVVVAEGDSIKGLARKFGTTVELIVKGNELKRPDIIRPGQRLKVFSGKMEIRASKGRHDLLLTANGRFFKRYRVGMGRYEKTPVGTFVITDRIPEPPWWRDDGKTIPFGDKENILGTRWMAIKATGNTREIKGYGIHGTWDTASIGKSESSGCIRLKNEDVEELFELVPVGTPVIIEE